MTSLNFQKVETMNIELEEDVRLVLANIAQSLDCPTADECISRESALRTAHDRLSRHKLSPGDKQEIISKYAAFAFNNMRRIGYREIVKILALITRLTEEIVDEVLQERLKLDLELRAAFHALDSL
ncbi:hypothetical protein [Roseibium sp.]|uniref:hypothetical protein n=1 Tax=Roseibium sp. TaxID=1936156 RepID=UPI003D131AA4